MLETLVTSKTRLKLLIKFFLNTATRSYLRNLEAEFGESTNGIRVELNRFEEAGMLKSHFEGNRKIFSANAQHPLFGDIHSILLKYTGIDQVVEGVLQRVGGLERAWLVGDLAKGISSDRIELLLLGTGINTEFIDMLVGKLEKLLPRTITYSILDPEQEESVRRDYPDRLLIFGD